MTPPPREPGLPLREGPGVLATRSDGQRLYAASDWLQAALAFCLGPAFVGGILVFIFQAAEGPLAFLPELGSRLVVAPFVMAPLAPALLAAMAGLMWIGWAGWGIVLAASTLIALIGALSLGSGVVVWVLFAWLHVAWFWWALHALEPDALARRVNEI